MAQKIGCGQLMRNKQSHCSGLIGSKQYTDELAFFMVSNITMLVSSSTPFEQEQHGTITLSPNGGYYMREAHMKTYSIHVGIILSIN